MRVGGRVVGNAGRVINGVGTLTGAGPDEISFLTNPRYRRQLAASRAGAIILREADVGQWSGDALLVDNPHLAYARIALLFEPEEGARPGIDPRASVAPEALLGEGVHIGPGAVIEADATIGAGCVIGPGCVIGRNTVIGDETRLVANVVVYARSCIGRRCLVHAGAVIGSDGFGFANDNGAWVKVPQLGRTVIGDDVEIGACTTIDRGAVEDTVIEDGVKLDNLIQVAHNVRIGAHTAIAACTGIAGSTTIGNYCAIGGGVGILGHLTIADRVTITPTSLVTKSIGEAGSYSSGTPLERTDEWQKNFARFKQLDDMARRLRAMERELEEFRKG